MTASELVEMYGTGKSVQSIRYSIDDEDEPLMSLGGGGDEEEESGRRAVDLDALFTGLPQARRLAQAFSQSHYSPPEATLIGLFLGLPIINIIYNYISGTRVRRVVQSKLSMEATLMDLAKARPMGDIVVKVKGRELIVLPDGINQYYTWELHEGLTRQTVLLVVSVSCFNMYYTGPFVLVGA